MRQQPQFVPGDPLATLRNCGGYYHCPRGPDGSRRGQLVAYAGTYGTEGKHYVGDLYLNCARLERFPRILFQFARQLADRIRNKYGTPDWIMGIPEGGRTLGALVALELCCEYIYPEKDKVPGGDARAESVMAAKRHEIEPNTKGVIIEDVCNNFSSTAKVVELVERHDAEVIGIACLFNRSGKNVFGHNLAVLAVLEVEAEQFQQDDPSVADDVAAYNVCWEPKKSIKQLVTIMENEEARTHAVETGA